MTAVPQAEPMNKVSTGKVALFIILISESVFFATLLVAYAALRDQNNWPIDRSAARLIIPLINSALLLVSAVPAARSIIQIRNNKHYALITSISQTLVLGLIFVGGQVYEFTRAGFHVNDQAFGGVFFTLMTFHALHVLAGALLLTIILVRARWGDFSSHNFDLVELGVWFWYYVIIVWFVLFAALYLI